MAAVGGELALLVVGEAEVELRVGVLCPLGLDAGLLREEDVLEVVGLAPAAVGEAVANAAKGLLSPFAEGREEVVEVAGGGGEEAGAGGLRNGRAVRGEERFLEEGECPLFGRLGVGAEGALAGVGLDPAGGEGDDLVVEARGVVAEGREAAEEDDAGDGVARRPLPRCGRRRRGPSGAALRGTASCR